MKKNTYTTRKLLGFCIILITSICCSEVSAQNMFVRHHSGQQETFDIDNISKLSFVDGNMLLIEENGNIVTYVIDDIRYLNFIDLVTDNIEHIQSTTKSITAFPVPATNMVNLKFHNTKNTLALLRITAINGKTIYIHDVELISGQNQIQINISSFPPGMYCCVVQTENNLKTVKFIKNL